MGAEQKKPPFLPFRRPEKSPVWQGGRKNRLKKSFPRLIFLPPCLFFLPPGLFFLPPCQKNDFFGQKIDFPGQSFLPPWNLSGGTSQRHPKDRLRIRGFGCRLQKRAKARAFNLNFSQCDSSARRETSCADPSGRKRETTSRLGFFPHDAAYQNSAPDFGCFGVAAFGGILRGQAACAE